MFFRNFLLLFLSVILFSCKKIPSKIDVSYDEATQKGILLVDGKDKYKLPEDSLSISIKLTSGEHIFKLNNEKEFRCFIPFEGGILNLNKESFVTISQYYTGKSSIETLNPSNIIMAQSPSYLIMDSLVYIAKRDSMEYISDAQMKYYFELDKKMKREKTGINFYKPEIFIAKSWSYGLNEDFPETIEVSSKDSFTASLNMESKSKVIQFSLFKLLAVMNPEAFEVRRLKDILSNKEDIKEDVKKSDNQMEMQ